MPLPYTSLLVSALSLGVSLEAARRMGLQQMSAMLRARNETRRAREGDGKSTGVRNATQADIRKFMS